MVNFYKSSQDISSSIPFHYELARNLIFRSRNHTSSESFFLETKLYFRKLLHRISDVIFPKQNNVIYS